MNKSKMVWILATYLGIVVATFGFCVLLSLTTSSCTLLGIEEPAVESTISETASMGQNVRNVAGGPYLHKILSAFSLDGLNWTYDISIRLDHASVPCAINDGNRIILYYVDADRGPGQSESISCAISYDGINFQKQPFKIDGMVSKKALDPSILRDANGQYRLYYLASDAAGNPGAVSGNHEIHLAISDDGINFRYDRPVFSYPGLVDPDVFNYQGKWFMNVPGSNGTITAISTDGKKFDYLQPLVLKNWATEAPVKLEDGSLRMYCFQEGKASGNTVHSFISTDGTDWIEEQGDRILADNGQKIMSPSVVRWGSGYKMFYAVENVSVKSIQTPKPQNQPSTEKAGPWDNDVLVFQIDPNGSFIKISTFERAGVPAIARLKDGRLIAAHQFFPADDPENFDKVAVRFSSDEGNSWTKPEVIRLTGLAAGMRFPFDPTPVVLPDGRIRLYFTSLKGQQFTESVPAIYSAISANGIDYSVEEGIRFAIENRYVIDCAVVLHKGIFHLFAPDNGAPPRLSSQLGNGYHATSRDGLSFTRVEDVKISGDRRWLGCAVSDGKEITFWGTSQSGGLWRASSVDGAIWQLLTPDLFVTGADPGAVNSQNGGWIVVATGPPRPATPSAQNSQVLPAPQGPGQTPSPPNPTTSVSDSSSEAGADHTQSP